LKYGIAPDQTRREGRWLMRGIHLLPRPGTVWVERAFAFRFDGINWGGYKDFEHPYEPYTGDHKFISDTNKYSLDRKGLLDNNQGMLYALDSCIKYQSTLAALDWIWYPKNAGPVKRTLIREISIDRCASHVHREMTPTATMMTQYRHYVRSIFRPDVDLVALVNRETYANKGACFDYHTTCPYIGVCI
jgi:hypothetical protein